VKLLSPVVWHEGMHLSQHHFQAQSRYVEELTTFVLGQLSVGPWGLLDLGLDEGALTNGTAALLHARGVLPDGTPFEFPQDPLPPPLAIRDLFSPTEEAQLLLLALPAFHPERANCALENGEGEGLRYSVVSTPVVDQVSGGDERPVQVARKNFRLILGEGEAEGMVSLPVARIRRDGSGRFVYDPEYVAPSLRIGASGRLMDLLARLVAMLEAKGESLRTERREESGGSSGELASHWLAHAVHSVLPRLRQMLQTRAAHPEQLFAELSRLAGALCTFSLQSHPGELPVYDHASPDGGFARLEAHIREHLGQALPAGALTVPLTAATPSGEGKEEVLLPVSDPSEPVTFYTGSVQDSRMFGKAEWYLGVRSSRPLDGVVNRVPEVMKVCSAKFVARLVREALPGIGMAHDPSPPHEVGARDDTQYFRLLRTEPCWAAIVQSREVGIYVPASIPDVRLSLSVVLAG
jgi:type VI secretion system protein ImpJ